MLHKFIILLLSALAVMMAPACSKQAGRCITIDNPAVGLPCEGLIITRVELTDSATRVDFHLYSSEDCWANLDPSAHITSKSISYPMIGYEGLIPNRKVLLKGDNREMDFTLTFAPLPATATEFNFLEGRNSGSWRIIGVKLKDSKTAAEPYAHN